MASATLHDAVRTLRRMTLRHGEGSLSDAGLLEGFVTQRDESAFEALVQRHGPMVLGVCRRLLRHEQDAEDAFQAVFIVLVRKAESLQRGELLGNWLYGVAHRTALEARLLAARRRGRETTMGQVPEREAREQEDWSEARPILDEELGRLPEKYRAAVVLCDLEGKTRKEAARQLRLPEGTLNGRLTAAHRLLAQRLRKRGVTLALAAMFLSLRTASAGLPPGLMTTTMVAVRSVATGNAALTSSVAVLTEGMVKTMLMTRIKLASAFLLAVGLVLAGTGSLIHQAMAERPATKAVLDVVPSLQEKKPALPTISGTAKEVDNKKGIITVAIPKGKGKEVEEITYQLPKDVKVSLADVFSKEKAPPAGVIGDVSIGTHVTLQLTEDKKSVVSILARGPGINGGVKEVDAEKGTITLSIKDSSGPSDLTLAIEKGARIMMSDGLSKDEAPKEGKLSDLKAGMNVQVQLSVDRRRALHIQPQGKTLNGTLKGIDKGNNTVTIEVKEAMLVEKSFTLKKGARVDENAAAGDRVNVRLSVFDDTIAVSVQAVGKK